MTRPSQGCEGCPISTSRRTFLQEALAASVTALVALGVSQTQAFALPVSFEEALAERTGARQSYPIPKDDGATIDKKNDVILVRWENAVYAFNLSCPHQNTALRWNGGAHRFKCPKHGSQYTPDGTFVTGRATRGMDRLPITREGETVVVDTGTLFMQDKYPEKWASAVVKLRAS